MNKLTAAHVFSICVCKVTLCLYDYDPFSAVDRSDYAYIFSFEQSVASILLLQHHHHACCGTVSGEQNRPHRKEETKNPAHQSPWFPSYPNT